MRSFKGTTPIYLLGRIISLLFSFALLPFLTRLLPKEDFGIVGLLWLIIPLTRRMIDFGSDVSVSLKFFKLTEYQLSNWVYHALSICIVSILLWFVIIQFGFFESSLITRMDLCLILIIGFFQSINNFKASLAKMEQNPWIYILLTNLPQILGSLFTMFIVVFFTTDYKSYLWGTLLGQGIIGLAVIVLFYKKYDIKSFRINWGIYQKIFKIGLPIIPGTISVIILASGDRYVIERLISLEAVAIYTLGYRMAEYFLTTIIQPIQNSLTPKIMRLAHEKIEEGVEYCERVVFKIVLGILIFFILTMWLQRWGIQIVGGESYMASYPIYLLILIGVLISSISSLVTILFNHFEKTYQTMLINIVMACLNIGMNFLFIPLMGIKGACIATIITFIMQQPLLLYALNRYINKPFSFIRILLLELLTIGFIGIFYFIEIYSFESIQLEIGLKVVMSILFALPILWWIFRKGVNIKEFLVG